MLSGKWEPATLMLPDISCGGRHIPTLKSELDRTSGRRTAPYRSEIWQILDYDLPGKDPDISPWEIVKLTSQK